MPEWKDTCNLPRTAFSMKANLQTAEPEAINRWQQMDLYGQLRSSRKGAQEISAARWPAVRQRRDSHRHGAQQGPQGSCGEVAQHGGLRCALRAWLGLSRPADRTQGRSPAGTEEARDVGRRLPSRVPRLRREVRRHHAPGLQTAGRLRIVGQPLPDDGARLPGGDRAFARPLRRAGHGLQGQEARALVHALPDRARRSRSRVRAAHVAVDLRRVPAQGRKPRRTRRHAYPLADAFARDGRSRC